MNEDCKFRRRGATPFWQDLLFLEDLPKKTCPKLQLKQNFGYMQAAGARSFRKQQGLAEVMAKRQLNRYAQKQRQQAE